MKIAVIGAGVSGLTIARLLNEKHDVTVFEKNATPGGLVRCAEIEGATFHMTGGHVFNTKRQDVLDLFWSIFDRDSEFTRSIRNSAIALSEHGMVGYPIENHVYQLGEDVLKSFVSDLVAIIKDEGSKPNDFKDFLVRRFGQTLYDLYFGPYNTKVWRRDLSDVPLSWLEGKLPMPTPEEMIYNNVNQVEEREFVHSTFYYPKNRGSQYIADRLSEGLDIRYNSEIDRVTKLADGCRSVMGETYDRVIFCGNIKQLPMLLPDAAVVERHKEDIKALESHGTTTVFCEIDPNPYSWIYQPSSEHQSHRIICTGNFSASNNGNLPMTATIEFTDEMDKTEILANLEKMPFSPRYITHHYEKYTYPIQNKVTRRLIEDIRTKLIEDNFYVLGRFAQWEYFNMDAAMGAAIDLAHEQFDS